MSRLTQAFISRAALAHNFQRVRSLAPHSKIMAMIKANGYGHDIVTVAKTLSGADAFGVASIEEALMLRKNAITQEIVLMQGFFNAAELPILSQNNLTSIIHNKFQMLALTQTTLSQPIKIWLKIDTGMTRLGILPQQLSQFWQTLQNSSNVIKPIGIMSHLATADELDSPALAAQIACFQAIPKQFVGPRSLASSAAIIAHPEIHADWVRPGIMLYGASPFADRSGQELNLKPVMTLRSQLINVKHATKGSAVGYGGKYICPENMPVGVVTIGYGDGYSRHAANGTPVLINDTQVPLIGRISMDMLTVDLRTCPQAKIGDTVTLWGDGLPVETVAKCAETIAYELLCHMTRRVSYVFI